MGDERRLAGLDRIYMPRNRGNVFNAISYSIHGNSLGSDHAHVKLDPSIGYEEKRHIIFKWNASFLKDSSLIMRIKDEWLSLTSTMSFFGKIRHIARIYRWHSKEKAMAFKIEEMEVKRKLKDATKELHLDMYNQETQRLVNCIRSKMRKIEERIAKGAAIISRVKWKSVGDKCSKQFFRVVREKNSNSTILGLRNRRGGMVN